MQCIKQLMNLIIVISGTLLVASYFFPVEASWSPSDSWLGYWIGGGFVIGLEVILVEIAPYAAGLVILVALVLLRWPKIGLALITVFAALWLFSIVWYLIRFVQLPDIKFPTLWLILAVVIIPLIVIMMLFVSRKFKKKNTVLMLSVILAGASLLQQAYSVAFFMLEDKLLLNIGSVTGIAAATALFISLLVQRQVYLEFQKTTKNNN